MAVDVCWTYSRVSQTETMLPQFGFQAFACWQRSAGNYFKWKRWWWSMCGWGAVGELLGWGAEEECVCLENEALQLIHSLAGRMGDIYVQTFAFTICLIVPRQRKGNTSHTSTEAAPWLIAPIKACKNKGIEFCFCIWWWWTDFIWGPARTETENHCSYHNRTLKTSFTCTIIIIILHLFPDFQSGRCLTFLKNCSFLWIMCTCRFLPPEGSFSQSDIYFALEVTSISSEWPLLFKSLSSSLLCLNLHHLFIPTVIDWFIFSHASLKHKAKSNWNKVLQPRGEA